MIIILFLINKFLFHLTFLFAVSKVLQQCAPVSDQLGSK